MGNEIWLIYNYTKYSKIVVFGDLYRLGLSLPSLWVFINLYFIVFFKFYFIPFIRCELGTPETAVQNPVALCYQTELSL